MSEKLKPINVMKTLFERSIHGVSNSFICDSCEKTKDDSQSVMITDEWFICKSCFEKDSVQICQYSTYCALTGECDKSC